MKYILTIYDQKQSEPERVTFYRQEKNSFSLTSGDKTRQLMVSSYYTVILSKSYQISK